MGVVPKGISALNIYCKKAIFTFEGKLKSGKITAYKLRNPFISERGTPVPAKKESATATKKPARKPNPAFMKPLMPDATLAAVVGEKAIPRTEITKKLWAYIKKNGLQDQKNKRMINADDKLKALFGGKKQVSMFEMTKLVAKHVSG
jgi:chromatin remodeling complex protein RSC6